MTEPVQLPPIGGGAGTTVPTGAASSDGACPTSDGARPDVPAASTEHGAYCT